MSHRSDILRHLEPVVSPAVASRVSTPRSRLDDGDFQTLIDSARHDCQPTGRPVALPDGVTLTPDQRTRLEHAADAALAHDSRTALVLLDQRPLLLDVHERLVTEEITADPKSDRIITDIDTLIVSRNAARDGADAREHLLLRRLSGANAPLVISNLIEREGRGSSPKATHRIGA